MIPETLVPDPTRGGTFFYCPWERRVTTGGRISHWSCGAKKPGWATGSRFRTLAKYRRHYRKAHLGRFSTGNSLKITVPETINGF